MVTKDAAEELAEKEAKELAEKLAKEAAEKWDKFKNLHQPC